MFDTLLWLVPAAVAAAGLVHPRGGLLVLAACLPLFGSPPGGPYLAPLDAAGLAAALTAWRSGKATPSRLDRPVLAWIAVSLASLIPFAYGPPSWRATLLAHLAVVLPGVETWTTLYTWRAALNLLLGAALYVAVRRAFAATSLRPLGAALAGGLAAAYALGLLEHLGWISLGGYRAIGDPLYDPRMHSLFFHSGWLAEYSVLAAPFAVAALAAGRTRTPALALALAALGVLFLTGQRGAWATALAQVGAVAALATRRRGRPLPWRRLAAGAAVAALLLVGVAALRPGRLAALAARAEESVADLSGRPILWRGAFELALDRPLLGWGLGSFSPAYSTRIPRDMEGAWAFRVTAHNLYLHVLAERGLLGLSALALLTATLLAGVLRRSRQTAEGDEGELLSAGLAISFVGLLVYGLVQYMLFLKCIEWLVWMLAGAAATLMPRRPPSPGDRAALALAVLGLAAVPWRALALEPLRGPGHASFGFHETEEHWTGPLRWTEQRAAEEIPWDGEVLVLALANGHPLTRQRPVEVEVRAGGVTRRLRIEEWEEVRLEVGPPRAARLVVEIAARPTFRPFSDFRRRGLEPSRDIRRLGVAVGKRRWEGSTESRSRGEE